PIINDYDFSSFTPEFQIPVNGSEVVISTFLDVYLSNTTDEVCEISVVYGNQEDILWSHNLSDGPWGDFSGAELTLSLDQYIGEFVKLRFRSYGSSTSALWGWFLFNVNLTTYFDHELCAMDISGPTYLELNENGIWEVEVKNQGLNAENDFAVNLFSFKDDQHIASQTYNGSLSPGETGTVQITWSSNVASNTVLYAKIDAATDEFESNNKSKGSFLRVKPDLDYSVLFWDNDNGIESVVSPETGLLQQSHVGLTKALQASGVNFVYEVALPNNLEEFDIVITTMGNYCLS
ncbi:MAG: hypothetical protein K9H16_16470, partial [Bacteroidales bacterium]|nr:hypothetical protein [Bacteroidales bacterium]